MTRKTKIDFSVSLILIIAGSILMLLPLFNYTNVKFALIILMSIYLVSNIINYILVKESKDKEGLYTFIVNILSIVLVLLLDIKKPLNLASILLVWTLGMSLVKLKKADYYHDRKNFLWMLHIITLCIFLLISLLTSINLYYSNSVQLLMLGNFFFINGILDLSDPLTNYIEENK